MTPVIAQGNIFVILLNGFGDAFLALPALREITRRFHRFNVYLACFEPQISVLFGDLNVNFVTGRLSDKQSKQMEIQQLVNFNAYHPDSVYQKIIELYPSIPRYGFCDDAGRPIKSLNGSLLHMRDQYFEVLGWEPKYTVEQRQVMLRSETLQSLADFLEQAGTRGDDCFYSLHLDSLPEKMWNPDGWAEVINYLWRQYNFKPLILGEETREAKNLLKKFSFARKLPSNLGIDMHFAAVRSTDFFIGIDSIFAHVADSLQKRMIVLFGGSDEICWGPSNPNSIVVKPHYGELMKNINASAVIDLIGPALCRIMIGNKKRTKEEE